MRGHPARVLGQPQRQRPRAGPVVHVALLQEVRRRPHQLGVAADGRGDLLDHVPRRETCPVASYTPVSRFSAQVTIHAGQVAYVDRLGAAVGRLRREHVTTLGQPLGPVAEPAARVAGPDDQSGPDDQCLLARACTSCSHATLLAPYASGVSCSTSSVIAGSSGSVSWLPPGVEWSAYTLIVETNVQCGMRSASASRALATHDGVRATSTTASHSPSSADQSGASRSSTTCRAPSGTVAGLAARRAGDLVAARDGVGRDRLGQEAGASENEKSHCSNLVDGPEMGNHLFARRDPLGSADAEDHRRAGALGLLVASLMLAAARGVGLPAVARV